MDITPLLPKGRQIIQAYGDGGFRINEIRHEGPVLILPDSTSLWPVTAVEDITLASLDPVLQAGLAILLIGTGQRGQLVAPSLRRDLREKGVVIEVMDTGAACRTFNVLLVEDRLVAAALLPV